MKFLASQVAYFMTKREAGTNLRALLAYIAFLGLLVSAYTVLFHVIKLQVEGEQHSWITGLYWTLVVMSTLGFGDITFTSDIGRLCSVVVLLSGVVFLRVVLPFLFIRLYATARAHRPEPARHLAPRQTAAGLSPAPHRAGCRARRSRERGARAGAEPTAETLLAAGTSLVMLGSRDQRRMFADTYE